MKVAYHEYLELHSYFAVPGQPRLGREEFERLSAELAGLAGRGAQLQAAERARLAELLGLLHRDKP